MVIFYSYVSLPEGNGFTENYLAISPTPFWKLTNHHVRGFSKSLRMPSRYTNFTEHGFHRPVMALLIRKMMICFSLFGGALFSDEHCWHWWEREKWAMVSCARLITIRMIVVSIWNTMSMCWWWWWWRWRRWQATMAMTMVIIIMTVIMLIIIMTYHDYMPSSLSSLSLSSSWFPWHMYMHIYIIYIYIYVHTHTHVSFVILEYGTLRCAIQGHCFSVIPVIPVPPWPRPE